MMANDDEEIVLSKQAASIIARVVKEVKAYFAKLPKTAEGVSGGDIIPAVWVQTPSAVAPGASAVCTIYRQGVASTDTITVYNRWVNTTFEAGTRAVAGWIDGEWAIVTGECA